MATVVIFGGSFDPVSKSDLEIAEEASRFFDAEICFLALKGDLEKKLYVSLSERKSMLRIVLSNLDSNEFSFSVFDESQNDNSNLLSDIKEIKEHYFSYRVIFLLNPYDDSKLISQNALNEIKKLVQVYVPLYKENGYKFEANFEKAAWSDFDKEDSLSNPVSLFKNCSEYVRYYMETHRLYCYGKLASMVSEHRYLHSLQVAKLSERISKSNKLGCDAEAYVTGLFHDCAKDVDPIVSKKIMESDFPSYRNFPAWTFHEFIGSSFAKENFGIQNSEILDAIASHATGKKIMSTLGKIVYAADKIEPTRGYDSSNLIESCLKNYDDGFKQVLKENKLFLEKKGYVVDNALTKECFEYYLGE